MSCSRSPAASRSARRPSPPCRKGMNGVRMEGSSDIRELQVLGDWAYLRNHITVTVTPPGGKPVTRAGTTLTILRKDGREVAAGPRRQPADRGARTAAEATCGPRAPVANLAASGGVSAYPAARSDSAERWRSAPARVDPYVYAIEDRRRRRLEDRTAGGSRDRPSGQQRLCADADWAPATARSSPQTISLQLMCFIGEPVVRFALPGQGRHQHQSVPRLSLRRKARPRDRRALRAKTRRPS